MRLRWTRLAELDLDEIAEYIGQDSTAAAARVIGTRELVVGNLPYIIAYRVRDKDMEILRVLHTSRAWPEEL